MNRARLLPILLILAMALAGCGKSKSMVLLLPDPDGHVGTVEVTSAKGTQTLTQAGSVTRTGKDGTLAAPEPLAAQEQEQIFGPAMRAMPQKPLRFILYFETGGTKLTAESQADLPKVLAKARERGSMDVAVVGHSSAAGDAKYNIQLSTKRAELVRDMLVKEGLKGDMMEVTSHGSANPLVISKNPDEPKNRRVEVTIR